MSILVHWKEWVAIEEKIHCIKKYCRQEKNTLNQSLIFKIKKSKTSQLESSSQSNK